jgi:hypothetical protein
MPRTYFRDSGEAGYRLDGRLSFPQLLLILSCVILENSLPATLGDRRLIHDLVTRYDSDWYPCIGSEGFDEMKKKDWRMVTPAVQQFWETIQRFMVQQKLCELHTSSQTVREHLCHLLCWVEQILAQGLNALCIPRPNILSPMVDIDSRARLALVCMSLSVALAPFLHGCRI